MEGLIDVLKKMPENLPYVFYMCYEGKLFVYKRFSPRREPFLSRLMFWLSVRGLRGMDEKSWLVKLRTLVKDTRSFVHLPDENEAFLPTPETASDAMYELNNYMVDNHTDNPWVLFMETNSLEPKYCVHSNHLARETSPFIVFMWMLIEHLRKETATLDFSGECFVQPAEMDAQEVVMRWMDGDDTVQIPLTDEMQLSDIDDDDDDAMNVAVQEAMQQNDDDEDSKEKGEA